MKVEIRPCRDAAEMAEYGRIVSYVFASNDPSGMDEELSATLPEWTTCAFIDGRMATTLGAFPFTVRLNGAPVAMAGVTAVGTLPEYRRQGLLRKVMQQAFETMRDRGQSIAILWASMAAIYQRFGYGPATTVLHYSFDPRYAGFESGPAPAGAVRMVATDDAFPTIKQIYIQAATPRNLHIHRSSPLWHLDTLRPRKKDERVYVAVYDDAAGEPRGYIVYGTAEREQHADPGPGQTMTVKDFVALDMDAYRGLWEYIRRHDLVGRVEMDACLPEDDPAPELLLEPRMLNRRTNDGIWLRVVDAMKAFPQRPYGGRGELSIGIGGDVMCPWNNGTWLLETDGASTEVRSIDRKQDITVTPNALASLIAGHRSATHLARAGLLAASGEEVLHAADRIFHTEYTPHCPNGF